MMRLTLLTDTLRELSAAIQVESDTDPEESPALSHRILIDKLTTITPGCLAVEVFLFFFIISEQLDIQIAYFSSRNRIFFEGLQWG